MGNMCPGFCDHVNVTKAKDFGLSPHGWANWLLITTHSVLMIERLLPDMADKNITSLDSKHQFRKPYQSTYKLKPNLLLEENSS